jgi:hypothetical protein
MTQLKDIMLKALKDFAEDLNKLLKSLIENFVLEDIKINVEAARTLFEEESILLTVHVLLRFKEETYQTLIETFKESLGHDNRIRIVRIDENMPAIELEIMLKPIILPKL